MLNNIIDFQTPEWVCKLMVDLVTTTSIYNVPDTILEPTAGKGNLVKAIDARFPSTIIYTPPIFEAFDKRVDWIIANPPFSPMRYGYQILDRCFNLSDNIIILMPWLSIINSEKRTKDYIEKGLTKIIHLPRKAFGGSRVQTCILVFRKGYCDNITFEYAKRPES